MRTRPHLAAAIAAMLITAPCFGAEEGSAQEGAGKVATCTACHGPEGNSVNGEWPNLAGQNAAYTSQQLALFKASRRYNPVMSPQAALLSADDIADIAAYYAEQTPAGLEADPSYWEAGEALYRGGDRERGIPACMACHGPVGRGNPGAGYPALRAQHAAYTVKQLNDYAAETRYRSPEGEVFEPPNSQMMTSIAKRLTPEDIRNLASYIQGMR